MWESLTHADADPEAILSQFLLITFADLKKYKFYYWFAFPAFIAKPAWDIPENGWSSAVDKLSPPSVSGSLPVRERVIVTDALAQMEQIFESLSTQITNRGLPSFFLAHPGTNNELETAPIAQYRSFFANVTAEQVRAFRSA